MLWRGQSVPDSMGHYNLLFRKGSDAISHVNTIYVVFRELRDSVKDHTYCHVDAASGDPFATAAADATTWPVFIVVTTRGLFATCTVEDF